MAATASGVGDRPLRPAPSAASKARQKIAYLQPRPAAGAIEIPTPRWNTYDAARLKMPNLKTVPSTIQEHAWNSPIWYNPAK